MDFGFGGLMKTNTRDLEEISFSVWILTVMEIPDPHQYPDAEMDAYTNNRFEYPEWSLEVM